MHSSSLKLEKHPINQFSYDNQVKVLIVVLDGVGVIDMSQNLTMSLMKGETELNAAPFFKGNAVNASFTPHLAHLYSSPLFTHIHAHGTYVGLPSDDDMGNSEVGHNALGSGCVFSQGATLVNKAIETGSLFESDTWKKLIQRQDLASGKKTLHLCGLLSDGNVHSHISHIKAIIETAHKDQVKKIRLHMLLDGRDVGPHTSLEYIKDLESFIKEKEIPDCLIASGGGRTVTTMDRYESDWSIVERGYQAHVLGEGRAFLSITEAVETYRNEIDQITDQDLPAFVIHKNNQPVGIMEDNDSVIFFNFRGDRAIEFTRAMTEKSFPYFERKRFPNVLFAGMMQYDGDLRLPNDYLVGPPLISNTMTEVLSHNKIKQFACSETQKFGHVTYFWNGNKSGYFDKEFEHYVEIPSDRVPFDQRPWMKAADITDETIKQMRENSFRVGRINYPNGDMVGHTGHFLATISAMTSLDLCLGRLLKAAKETNTILIVTADHGNADEMLELDKKTGRLVFTKDHKCKVKTSHTLRPVPLAIYNAEFLPKQPSINTIPGKGLSQVAATALELAGFKAPSFYEPSLLLWTASKHLPEDPFKPNSLSPFEHIDLEKIAKNPANSFNSNQKSPDLLAAHELIELMGVVRAIIKTCAWCQSQSQEDFLKYLIEESYEAVEAFAPGVNAPSFKEELGDVLLQVCIHSLFQGNSLSEIITILKEKMIRRHPHVFQPEFFGATIPEIGKRWLEIKQQEREEKEKHLSAEKKKELASPLAPILKKRALPTLDFSLLLSLNLKNRGNLNDLSPILEALEERVTDLKKNSFSNQSEKELLSEVCEIILSLSNLMTIRFQSGLEPTVSLDQAMRQKIYNFISEFK